MQPPTPLGPHTHVLPRLLAAGRANAEDNDAPAYYRACVYLYPRHPLMDGLGNPKAYDREAHARFTVLMERWGDATCVAENRRARHAMRAVAGSHTDASVRNSFKIRAASAARAGRSRAFPSRWPCDFGATS